MGRGRRAERDQMMVVEILDLARLRAALQVVGRRIGVEMHGEQPAPDEVGLHRLAQAQRDVRLAHAEVEILVRQQKLQLHFRIKLDEFAEPRREPVRAETERGRHPQIAVRLLPAVDQPAADRVELENHVAHRAEQHFALLGQDEAARVAMEERRAEVGFERSDLTADGRLAQAQRLAGVGERPGVGGGLKDAQLVPVHERSLGPAGSSLRR